MPLSMILKVSNRLIWLIEMKVVLLLFLRFEVPTFHNYSQQVTT